MVIRRVINLFTEKDETFVLTSEIVLKISLEERNKVNITCWHHFTIITLSLKRCLGKGKFLLKNFHTKNSLRIFIIFCSFLVWFLNIFENLKKVVTTSLTFHRMQLSIILYQSNHLTFKYWFFTSLTFSEDIFNGNSSNNLPRSRYHFQFKLNCIFYSFIHYYFSAMYDDTREWWRMGEKNAIWDVDNLWARGEEESAHL